MTYIVDVPEERRQAFEIVDGLYSESSLVMKCGEELHVIVFRIIPGDTVSCYIIDSRRGDLDQAIDAVIEWLSIGGREI